MTKENEFPTPSAEVPSRSAKDGRCDAIIEIAQQTFVENGYAGTSMSAIAARVGGSKGTLYNHFKSKEELFVAVVERKCQQIQSLLNEAEIEGGGELRAALTKFGERFLALVLNGESVATYRLVTGECVRFPELGRAFYSSGVQENQRKLAEFFEHAKQLAQLRNDTDASVAAEQFIDLCLSGIHRRRLWNVTQRASTEEIRRNVANAVSTFMRAYGP